MKAKIMNWDEFREACQYDAQLWHDNGYTAEEITEDDILNEYPNDYFEDYTDDDISEDAVDYSTESVFTPDDFAKKTISYMREIEEGES